MAKVTKKTEVEQVNSTNENKNEEIAGGFSTEELLKIIQGMQEKISKLENKEKETEELKEVSQVPPTNNDAMVEILKNLASNKSNKEVVIVHNQEMSDGLATVINLSNLSIRFTHLGEQRVLSWQQFEELVSKYSSFISRGIILLDSEYSDLCDRYKIKCYNPKDKCTLTQDLLGKIGDYDIRKLEDTFKELSEENQKILISYWLGRCYESEKDPRFYNRYKLELLNRLSNSYVFWNIIADMNAEESKKRG